MGAWPNAEEAWPVRVTSPVAAVTRGLARGAEPAAGTGARGAPMPPRGALIPARFLTLTAHLVLLLLLSTRPAPSSVPAEEDPREVTCPLGALGGALALLGVEFCGFFSGASMFHHGQGLLSIGAHAVAALTLTLADLEGWDSAPCWSLFTLCR
uniref:Transmembrane protein 107 n=1 Tax=Melopsittacus undulatus TaxID=13146 RepID=A0A8V5HB37_MELUD